MDFAGLAWGPGRTRIGGIPRLAHSFYTAAALALCCGACAAADVAPAAPAVPAVSLAQALGDADAALSRQDLAAYRGWLKFLKFEAASAAQRKGPASAEAAAGAARLDEWALRISANPGVLGTLTGVQEWAYESPVDDSGQPFKMAIPTDYDPGHPAPLSVYMHGSGGNHLEHATAMAAHPGGFEMSVLGRARDGGFRDLSEADVLQAIAYVEAHWSIDPSRVGLRGGSMGGGGTYRLGSRYPHLWASGRPSCGFASTIPMGNLVTLPIYSTHSADDPVVSILHERGPLERLRELGGQVVFDETNGYGHAVWDYKEGNERGTAWVKDKVRPDSRTVRRIDYTATDGTAVRGWWAEIAEWGPEARNARFVLAAGQANSLFASLTNITRLSLITADSPLDRGLPLSVSVDGAVPIVLPAPLPDRVVLARGAKGWEFEAVTQAPAFRLHTPGSASLLYDGEPLLIVYGTAGTDAEKAALRAAADAASSSPNPSWPDASGEAGDEGTPNSQNLYGHLRVKADADVTASDLERCHLVLIGTAEQNSVVGRMAGALPVKLEKGRVTCSDGMGFQGASLAIGLVHYNPLAPGRLVFWVASDDPAAYRAKSVIPLVMSGSGSFSSSALSADLVVVSASTLVASRGFDSRWQWVGGRESSPLVGPALATSDGFSAELASALRRATGSDYALVGVYGTKDAAPVDVGVTRVADIAPLFGNVPVGVMTVPGSELLEMARKATGDSGIRMPGFAPEAIDGVRRYTVAIPVSSLWAFAWTMKTAPREYQLTDLDTRDVIERYLAPR